MPEPVQLLIDHPLPGVCRLTLKRPEERNALNNRSRAEIFAAPEHNDRDPDLRLTVLRGARGRAAAGAGRHQPAQRAPGYGNHGLRTVIRAGTELQALAFQIAKPVLRLGFETAR